MMDELKQQFYEVMHKYQKPFSEEGVTANLTQWYEQKQGLLQLLRRHPLWNEKELAIVFRVEERREIDRATVDETRAAILELGRRACTDDTVYENFETALRAYFARDEIGFPLVPLRQQRPILLIGPPGIGKTAIMEQIAEECGVGLVAYTMTHHTRQSAMGLPEICKREIEGKTVHTTEYTMSEIIASIYDCMEQTKSEAKRS